MCPKIPSKGVFIAGKARVSGFAGSKNSKVSDLIKQVEIHK